MWKGVFMFMIDPIFPTGWRQIWHVMTFRRRLEGCGELPVQAILAHSKLCTMPMLEGCHQCGGKCSVSGTSSNGGDKVLNKPKLASYDTTEMVKRTAVLLAVVALVTAIPASDGSYADTEDLINELDRPSKYTISRCDGIILCQEYDWYYFCFRYEYMFWLYVPIMVYADRLQYWWVWKNGELFT